MACRCADIYDYGEDIKKLINAEGYAQELVGQTNDVRSTLDELKSEYDATLEATGEFLAEFAKLDEGANANALCIVAQIQGAKLTVETKLRQALQEDTIYHESIGQNQTNPHNSMELIQ